MGEATAPTELDPFERKLCQRLNPGAAWNPLKKYPRNKGCICGSGEKFKRCCLPRQPRTIQESEANKIVANWDRLLTGKLVIVPPEKQARKTQDLPFVDPASL